MKIIRVYSWNPAVGSNFGDVIGPMIVQRIADLSRDPIKALSVSSGPGKMLCVGSILQSAERGDVIWGSGVNGKSWIPARIGKLDIQVRGVRGPISRAALQSIGVDAPEIYGDPGLLFPTLYHNEIMAAARKVRTYYETVRGGLPETVFIPNLNDERFYLPEANMIPPDWEIINTSSSPMVVAAQIMLAKRVVASSLHGLVFGDYYGKDCVAFESRFEPRLKYDDYYLGTGRDPVMPIRDLSDDVLPNVLPCTHDMGPMIAAFPWEVAEDESQVEEIIVPQRVVALARQDVLQESPNTIVFPLHKLSHLDGWANPMGHDDAKYLWCEKTCTILIDRDMAREIKMLTIFFSKISPEVRTDRIRAAVDNIRAEAEFVHRNGVDYLRIDTSKQNIAASSPCKIKINYGRDSDPSTAFGSNRLSERRFSVQVRKVGASLYEFDTTSVK